MSIGLYKAVTDARIHFELGYGLEEAVRIAAAEHLQDPARVAIYTASAVIGKAQAALSLACRRPCRERASDDDGEDESSK